MNRRSPQHRGRMSALERERMERRRRRAMRRRAAICALALLLAGIVTLYCATDLLDWARVIVYPIDRQQTIDDCAAQYGLDPALVCAVIYAESRFRTNAVSVDGARGMMQIMPETGQWIAPKLDMDGYTDEQLFDPEVNIRLGCWYLDYLLDRFGGDVRKALAAYNAGQGSVDRWMNDPECSPDGVTLSHIPIRETRNYVKKVMAAHDIYIDLYYSAAEAQ